MPVRALTASVLIGGFLAALYLFDHGSFAALTALAVAASAYEWAKLCRLPPVRAGLYAAVCLIGFGVAVLALYPVSIRGVPERFIFGAASFFWIVIAPGLLQTGLRRAAPILPVLGLLVIVPAGFAILAIPPGLLLAALVLVWISDTAAYAGGRAFGRRRLAPTISPGKTWEGLLCGLAAALIYAIIYATLLPDAGERLLAGGWAAYLAVAAALCLAGVLGDLFESAMKRQAGVKDSGSLLPGHGGILDRIDSATAVLPMTAFLLQWVRLG